MSKTSKVDMETNARLAQEAIARGDNKYLSVNPCSKGHLMRYTSNNKCVDCKLAGMRKCVANYTPEQKRKQMLMTTDYIKRRYHSDPEFRAKLQKQDSIRKARKTVIRQADRLLATLARLEALQHD